MVKRHPFRQLTATKPIMHEVFKVAFGHCGVYSPHPLPKSSTTKTVESILCRNSNYYKNFCLKWLGVKMVLFLLTSGFFFLSTKTGQFG